MKVENSKIVPLTKSHYLLLDSNSCFPNLSTTFYRNIFYKYKLSKCTFDRNLIEQANKIGGVMRGIFFKAVNVLTLDCCMLLGTLVWHCELKKREADLSEMGVFLKYKQQSNSFNKVISHSNSAKSSIYKTVSLSMGYRLWLIECSNWNPYMVRCTPH